MSAARLRELLRRRLAAGLPRALGLGFASVLLFCLCFVLSRLLCLTTVTTSNGERAVLLSPDTNPAWTLALAGVSTLPEDAVTVTATAPGVQTISVQRSFVVSVQADGKKAELRTVPRTVREALMAGGVALGVDDFTEPALTEPVTEETGTIVVHRVTHTDRYVDEVIPYETQYQATSLFYRNKDKQMVIQAGQNGYWTADLRDTYVDGVLTESTVLNAERYEEPVPEIIKVYGEGAPVSSVEAPANVTVENGVPSTYTEVYDMKATGYYSPRGKGSSGLGLYYGTIAVDPTLIPYGTKVYITSEDGRFVYGWAISTDTGAFIHSNRMQVDLFYETYAESAANGVQYVRVYVVEPPAPRA